VADKEVIGTVDFIEGAQKITITVTRETVETPKPAKAKPKAKRR
jgi:hypothetical protein